MRVIGYGDKEVTDVQKEEDRGQNQTVTNSADLRVGQKEFCQYIPQSYKPICNYQGMDEAYRQEFFMGNLYKRHGHLEQKHCFFLEIL